MKVGRGRERQRSQATMTEVCNFNQVNTSNQERSVTRDTDDSRRSRIAKGVSTAVTRYISR